MGDSRFAAHYERIQRAQDKAAAIHDLDDDQVVQALAAASRERDPYVANVLATEAMNRMRQARAIAANLAEGAFAVDAALALTFVNPSMDRMLGGGWARRLGAPLDEVLLLHDPSGRIVTGGPECPVRRCLDTRAVLEWEGGIGARAGPVVEASMIVAPIGRDGEVEGAVVAFRDVTERKRVERERDLARAAAEQERLRLQAVLDQMPSGVVVASAPEGRILFHNREALEIAGPSLRFSGADAGRPSSDIFHPDGTPYDPDDHPLARALKGEVAKLEEMTYRRGDGTFARLAVSAAPVRDASGAILAAVATFHDVAEARRAQERLRTSEARLRGVLTSLREGLLLFDPEGRLVFSNTAARAGLGLPEGPVADQTRGRLRFFTPEGEPLPPERTPVGIVLGERRAVHDMRLVVETLHRGRREFVVSALPIEGNGVVASFEDVTDDLEAQRRLRLGEEMRRRLVDAVQDYAIFTLGLDGRILTWNQGAADVTGWTQEEAVGQPFDVLFTEEDAREGRPERELRQAAEQGTFSSQDAPRRRKDGTTFPADVHVSALRDEKGRARAFVTVVRDLTERRRVEDALRRSEAQYRALVESSPEPMAVHAGGKLLFINQAGARLIGAAEDGSLLGRDVLDFVHPESVPLVKERLAKLRASPEILPPAEERFVRLDGRTVDVETVAIPILYEGQPAVQLIFRDITPRKEYQRELERRVAERTAELQRAVHDLETFSNSASHDLRAPLRGVEALLEDALDALARGDGSEAKELAALARRENLKAQRLVHDLLSFAKSGKAELRREDVDVTALAEDIARALSQTHPDRGTAWRVEPGMRAWADPGLLRIALHNLMDNAGKYAAKAEAPLVEVDAREGADETVLRVKDNGVGFPMEEVYRLFETFARLSTAYGFEGTGLGLSTVQRVVERHGGRVWAESLPGQGATFHVSLPKRPLGVSGKA